MKTCTKCGEEKPKTEFHKLTKAKDGLQFKCKACAKNAGDDWVKRNKERRAETAKRWWTDNGERYAIQKREEYKLNREERLAKNNAWNRANKDKIRQIGKQWVQANLEKVRLRASLRRATVLKAIPSWADEEQIKTFYEAALAFKIYTGQTYEVDHIVPVGGKSVCGLHCEANLQVVTLQENRSKGNRIWPDMW